MANIVLALQGGVANGTEETFDGQPMEKGVHLRWSFLAALGFPPGGFWLCRREAKDGEKHIPPPPSGAPLQTAATDTAAMQGSSSASSTNAFAAGPASGNEWQTVLPAPCQSVTLAGCAAPGCDEVLIETFCCNADGKMTVSGRRAVPVEQGAFRITVQASEISCVRVVGAGSIDECGCGTIEPPKDCGCGGGGGQGGGNPPCTGDLCWGKPNENGWQCWGVPFVLPVTVEQWPARYFGAPDPATTATPVVEKADIKEAVRRLGTLKLAANLTLSQQNVELAHLRSELVRLVQGFPTTLLNEVPLQAAGAGANAPNLSINLMQELLLLALDPYFARVLGLYFVDEQATPGVLYDYSITGYWGATPCDNTVIFPGLAPGAPLARGSATFGGITIAPLGGNTSLWRWTKFGSNGNYNPRVDPSSPSPVQSAAAVITGALAQAQQPDALLLATSPGAWFMPAAPCPQVSITLSQRVPRVDVQAAGNGTVQGLSQGIVVSSASFNSSLLATVTVNSPSATQLIDHIKVNGTPVVSPFGYVLAVGSLTLHPLSPEAIGTRYAIIPPPVAIQQSAAPGQPYSTFRHRQADIDTTALALVPHSLIDVEWPAPLVPASQLTGDPVSDPLQLPPPTQPIGFVAEREDSAVAGSAKRLSGWIATRSAPKPKGSNVPTAGLYRLVDSQLADPVGGWSHRVAAFDIFGALGIWSNWSAPRGVEKIAAAPTALRIVQFDNSPAGGGAAAPDGSKWSGGTLNLKVNWAGAVFMMYPDIATARIIVAQSIDTNGVVTGQLATSDLVVRKPTIQQLSVASMAAKRSADGLSYTVEVQTTPPLVALASTDPAQVLMLTLPDGSSERYCVRPAVPASAGLNAISPVVASLTASNSARIITSTSDYIGQPAYLLPGYGVQTLLSVPLDIPVAQQSARAQFVVTGSTQSPFLVNEQIVDPNGINPNRTEPQSVTLGFSGPQRLTPPPPPQPPPQLIPAHQVHHLYYNPADANGNANQTLPFTTPPVTGVLGYVLQREPIRSLSLADVKRRASVAKLADNNPAILDSGVPRADLAAWIASLTEWLNAYNAVGAYSASIATPPRSFTPLTAMNVLEDAGGQRAFIEHFYGGLLDDELCALGDVTGNSAGFVRVNPQNFNPETTISDTVDGTGYGRTVYRLSAVNQAGSFSSNTSSIGPYYTRIVSAPRPPVLYKLQPTESGIVVAWALDTNPDVAAYILYRAASVGDLRDLRFFGADPSHPSPAGNLPSVTYNEQSYPPLTFVQGTAPDIDARMIGFVPDPRLCARDYDGSDMGEVVLPSGPRPDEVQGVFRLSDYATALGPLGQLAFNYWTPPAVGGIAQVQSSLNTQSRLTGLRIGLGRGVPVVVVATWNNSVKVIGLVPVRRAGFIDGVTAGGNPLDTNAIAGAPAPNATALNAYAVVAVDIFGNRSAPSSIFAAQMLVPVAAV